MFKNILIAILLFSGIVNFTAQTSEEIYDILKSKDSLLFNAVFDLCDSLTAIAFISEDFEFYHDQSGITNSKAGFMQSIQSLCTLPYDPRRELDPESLEMFPLYNEGKLYGAIQSGVHKFYAKEVEKHEYLTSTARFTHLWILENGEWKLKRVLSFDHQVPGD
ncbi:MAG TPA: nuclear transport factor 2 family protein [Saprospiraceae bacterium]|nr:nuclear transport factor 2 family protein [Saprospiraceae bacterium]